jgi:hypothetical protein
MSRQNVGISTIILSVFFISVIMIGIAVGLRLSNTKSIQSSIATEYDMRTYYVAMAGINECIAARMVPRSNVLARHSKFSAQKLKKFNRVENTGIIYTNPYRDKDNDIIGKYTYVSYIIRKDNHSNIVIDEFASAHDDSRYLVYSKGVTLLPDGTEDTLFIKAIFDLNRKDNDFFDADEIEHFEVIPSSKNEAKIADNLILEAMADKSAPLPRSINFTAVDPQAGLESNIQLGTFSSAEQLDYFGVRVNSKISITFNEPIDPNFLDGIKLTKVNTGQPVKPLEKIALSPGNTEVVLFPPKKNDGKMLEYATDYELQIAGVTDYNGNRLNTNRSVKFSTELAPPTTLQPTQATSCDGCSESQPLKMPPDNTSDPFSSENSKATNNSNNNTNQNKPKYYGGRIASP